jgi:hypothetical protein
MSRVIKPFRWDLSRREQLGSLVSIEPPTTPEGFDENLLKCCARVLAFAGDSDLVFVGRSPETLFDLLSGLLFDTSWQTRLSVINLSLGWVGESESTPFVEPYFEEVGLLPSQLARRERPVAFIDVVSTGKTFASLIALLERVSRREAVKWESVARKIRFVGLTAREKTSPNTWRWQQHADWVGTLVPPRSIKNVSIPFDFLIYLTSGPKTSLSFNSRSWGDDYVLEPLRDDEARSALALALRLFDLGRTRETRLLFAAEAARQQVMSERWFRSLILEVKRTS